MAFAALLLRLLAEEEGTVSPMAKTKSPKVPITDVTVATEEDITRMLRAISPFRTFPAARDAAIVSLLWATGLRRTELAEPDVSDLDLDAGRCWCGEPRTDGHVGCPSMTVLRNMLFGTSASGR